MTGEIRRFNNKIALTQVFFFYFFLMLPSRGLGRKTLHGPSLKLILRYGKPDNDHGASRKLTLSTGSKWVRFDECVNNDRYFHIARTLTRKLYPRALFTYPSALTTRYSQPVFGFEGLKFPYSRREYQSTSNCYNE